MVEQSYETRTVEVYRVHLIETGPAIRGVLHNGPDPFHSFKADSPRDFSHKALEFLTGLKPEKIEFRCGAEECDEDHVVNATLFRIRRTDCSCGDPHCGEDFYSFIDDFSSEDGELAWSQLYSANQIIEEAAKMLVHKVRDEEGEEGIKKLFATSLLGSLGLLDLIKDFPGEVSVGVIDADNPEALKDALIEKGLIPPDAVSLSELLARKKSSVPKAPADVDPTLN